MGPRARSARRDDSSSDAGADVPESGAAVDELLRAVEDDIGGFAAPEPALVSAEVCAVHGGGWVPSVATELFCG